MAVSILHGDCRDVLKTLPDASVHCVVTSPPYWGLRDYGVSGQIGLESTYQQFVAEMVGVFREVRRVLRPDGTLWLNLGDSYNNRTKVRSTSHQPALNGFTDDNWAERAARGGVRMSVNDGAMKEKDLCGIPWRVAFALQDDGWYLRQDIIWAKPNPMPESVTDRCTKSHEYLFLLSKSARYYFDAEAIKEAAVYGENRATFSGGTERLREANVCSGGLQPSDRGMDRPKTETRNKRSVWEVATAPFSEAHFATFPPALIEPCIKAGTSEKGCCRKCGAPWVRQMERTAMVLDRSERTHDRGHTRASGTMLEPPTSKTLGWSPSCKCNAPVVPCTVLDSFGGAGTSGLVADRLQRNAILIELNPTYAEMAKRRIHSDAPLFAEA